MPIKGGSQTIRSIHDSITRLKAFRATGLSPIRERGRLAILDDFGSNPGALIARTYLPASFIKGAPLVVVLHGCTQTAEGYDHNAGWSSAADDHGFALLFPEQTRANNLNLCFNWYSDADAGRGRGEALSIQQMVATMHARFGTSTGRVFVTGLSAGGAMTAVMLASYPEVFAGGGIIAGLPFGIAHSVPQAFDRMRGHGGPGGRALSELVRAASDHSGSWPTLSVWHGSGDMIVDPSNAKDLIEQWSALHGVSNTPSRTDKVEGYPHRTWCDRNGRAVIEEYSITGMAHGTPLDTNGETGEIAGAHMLEAGISSTRQLLRFWGIAKPGVRIQPAPATVAKIPRRAPARRRPDYAGSDIGKTIEQALRSAGLLR